MTIIPTKIKDIFYFIVFLFIEIDVRKLISVPNGFGVTFHSKLKVFENMDTSDIWIISKNSNLILIKWNLAKCICRMKN